MKKTTFIIAFLATLFSVNASAQKLVVPDVNFGDGSTANLVVSVESESVAALVEFELDLPEGVTVEKDDEGYFYDFGEILRSSGRKPHSITVEDRENGNIYVLVCDPKGGTFEAASGTVVSLPLVKGENFSGSGKGTLSKIILSDVDANQMTSVTTIEFNITAGDVAAVPYYLVGNMTSWGVDAAYQLTKNDAAETEEYMITLDLADDAQFKIAKSDDGITIADDAWYPGGMGNAYGEHGELAEAGNYTVYFRPNADGGDGWFNNLIYVVTNSTVGIRGINVDGTNGDIYNTAGQRVVKAGKGLYIQNGKKVVKK